MRILFALLIVNICCGQSLVIGLKAGGRVTDDISSWATSESKRYTVGPTIELGLPFGLGLEADALYSREGFSFDWNGTERQSVNQWQVPVTLKYRFPVPLVKPYLEFGWVTRVGSGTIVSWKTTDGLVFGGGVQFGIGRLRLSPGVRIMHWNNPAVLQQIPNGPTISSAENEVSLLVGFGWKVH